MHYFYQNPESSSDDEEYNNDNEMIIIDTDEESDDDLEDYEEIYNDEQDYVESEKADGSYCIGSCLFDRNQDAYLLSIAVKPETFMNYSFHNILRYLQLYSCNQFPSNKIDIMKMAVIHKSENINNSLFNYTVYSCIIKTHWLRLVQRHWRKVFAERRQVMQTRLSLNAILGFQLTGQYPEGARYMPTLEGMMSAYSNRMMIMQ